MIPSILDSTLLLEPHLSSWYGCEPSTEKQLLNKDEMLKILKKNLNRAQLRIKAQVDTERQKLQFKVSDNFFVK